MHNSKLTLQFYSQAELLFYFQLQQLTQNKTYLHFSFLIFLFIFQQGSFLFYLFSIRQIRLKNEEIQNSINQQNCFEGRGQPLQKERINLFKIFKDEYQNYNYHQLMFLGVKRGLKSIDFYQAVPSELSQGTISGACISIVSTITLILLIIVTINNFLSPRMGSDLIIDQEHLDQKLKVNIDISFPKFPCSMLSLDIENILKVHQVNVGGSLMKYTLPENNLFTDAQDRQQKKRRAQDDFKQGKGCRMKGWFEIDRVPGNFHFSCHGYSDIIQQFLNEGGYRQAHKTFDLTHVVHQMWFGQTKAFKSTTLRNFQSHKQIGEGFLGISYTYFLDIVQFNQFNSVTNQSMDSYSYTVRMNEVILATFPMVYFKYETNPIAVFWYSEYAQWHELFVKIVGIIGGIFTVATILDGAVHSSLYFLIEKQRLGKLK